MREEARMGSEQLDELSLEVFRTFARCEYALKAAGYVQGANEVKADWKRFAANSSELFERPPSKEFEAAIRFLLDHPPQKQVYREGKLQWSSNKPDANSEADLTLAYVRRVRNNLFHGGKFNGHWFAPQRSLDLLSHSLCVLRHVIQADADVRKAYGEESG